MLCLPLGLRPFLRQMARRYDGRMCFRCPHSAAFVLSKNLLGFVSSAVPVAYLSANGLLGFPQQVFCVFVGRSPCLLTHMCAAPLPSLTHALVCSLRPIHRSVLRVHRPLRQLSRCVQLRERNNTSFYGRLLSRRNLVASFRLSCMDAGVRRAF